MSASSLDWCTSCGTGLPYLWACPFLVRTDHYALKYMLDQRLSTVPQHQWISKLYGFDFRVEYNPGRCNTVADALSRRDGEVPPLAALNADTTGSVGVSLPAFDFYHELCRDLAGDDALRPRYYEVAAGAHGPP